MCLPYEWSPLLMSLIPSSFLLSAGPSATWPPLPFSLPSSPTSWHHITFLKAICNHLVTNLAAFLPVPSPLSFSLPEVLSSLASGSLSPSSFHPRVIALPRAQPSAHYGENLFNLMAPVLHLHSCPSKSRLQSALPVVYWTFPMSRCHLEFSGSETRQVNHSSPHPISTFLSMVPSKLPSLHFHLLWLLSWKSKKTVNPTGLPLQ